MTDPGGPLPRAARLPEAGRRLSPGTWAILAAATLLAGCYGPTRNQAKLKAIKAEADQLMATYPIDPQKNFAVAPKIVLPPAIASLRPEFVIVDERRVDILIKPYFDGGWGYEIPRTKSDLGKPVECYSEPAEGVFWHGPC